MAARAREEATSAEQRASRLEAEAAIQQCETEESRREAADRIARLHVEAQREREAIAAVVREYIALRRALKLFKDGFISEHGREPRSQREVSAGYREACKRQEELKRMFPGRPWANDPEYIALMLAQ